MSRLFIAPRALAPRTWNIRAVVALAAASLFAAMSGCGTHEPLQSVVAPRCMSINGATPVELRVAVPTGGPLRVLVEQRGISVVSTLRGDDHGKRGRILATSSPSERYGVMTFLPDLRAGDRIVIGVRAHDSPDVTGQVCVRVDPLAPGERDLLRAERAFASAGQAVNSEDWRRAF